MQARFQAVKENINQITKRTVTLVAVSKTKSVQDIQSIYDLGHRIFGENYVQEILTKAPELPQDIRWHFIGNLQSNKIKQLLSIPNLDVLETIDSESKAKKVNQACMQLERNLNVFVQVNTSGESNKSGCLPDQALHLCKSILETCPQLSLQGLMTIGEADRLENINPDFACLVNLRNQIEKELNISLGLSMGMSGDYEHAIEMGSTNIRVGSVIFGSR